MVDCESEGEGSRVSNTNKTSSCALRGHSVTVDGKCQRQQAQNKSKHSHDAD